MSVERVLSGKIARLIGCLVCGVFLCLIAGCGEDSGEGDDGSRAKSVGKAELIEKGRELFERNGCPICHGEEGKGNGKIANTLRPPPRNFGDLAAYKQGAGVEEMVKTFAGRRDRMLELLASIEGVTCVKPEGSFYAFPRFSSFYGKRHGSREINGSMDLAGFLMDEAKVAIVPGSAFGADEYIRLSYATSMENIEEGLERIIMALTLLD